MTRPTARALVGAAGTTGTSWSSRPTPDARVATADGSVRPIDPGGATVTSGDGLELQGRTLHVVRNSVQRVTEVRLTGHLGRGRVVAETTDPTLQSPTTAALHRGRLLVVNSQFDQRDCDPVEPFTVSSVERP